jgi:rSAM/selenodomain-associated transferase 2
MISIIIPVLNEKDTIGQLLLSLIDHATSAKVQEILISDGGSVDGTQKIVQKIAKNSLLPIYLISSEKGRAKQMNHGAKVAKGSILYFLHADSYPPKNFDRYILDEVESGNPAGCFKMRFDSDHWWLRLAGWLTQFNWRACRGGDQSQFITKTLFEEIGGFDESYIIYEDNILIDELFRRESFTVIQQWITSSARLYREKGIWQLQYHFWMIYLKKWMGADAEQLFAYYSKHIKSRSTTASSTSQAEVQVILDK